MKKRALLIENEIGNIELERMQLERLDYEVIVAINGRDGIDKAASELPDVIIMDILMPVMDGYEANQVNTAKSENPSHSDHCGYCQGIAGR